MNYEMEKFVTSAIAIVTLAVIIAVTAYNINDRNKSFMEICVKSGKNYVLDPTFKYNFECRS